MSRSTAEALRRMARRARYFGSARYCPLCRAHVRGFLPAGLVPRADARCPVCASLERHRLVWLFFERRTDLLRGKPKKMLHVAPEPQLQSRLERIAGLDYLTADLFDPRAMVRMDITDISHGDGEFDVIYCSHVLEHVDDDRKAMREFHRVLAPGGWAVLQVPITAERTFEDPSVTDPAERERRFGQDDHVRCYGPDFVDRLEQAGFRVDCVAPADVAGPDDARRLGITDTEDVHFCTKPVAQHERGN